MLTSSNQSLDIHNAYAFRANAYITKPSGGEGSTMLAATLRDFWFLRGASPLESSRFATLKSAVTSLPLFGNGKEIGNVTPPSQSPR